MHQNTQICYRNFNFFQQRRLRCNCATDVRLYVCSARCARWVKSTGGGLTSVSSSITCQCRYIRGLVVWSGTKPQVSVVHSDRPTEMSPADKAADGRSICPRQRRSQGRVFAALFVSLSWRYLKNQCSSYDHKTWHTNVSRWILEIHLFWGSKGEGHESTRLCRSSDRTQYYRWLRTLATLAFPCFTFPRPLLLPEDINDARQTDRRFFRAWNISQWRDKQTQRAAKTLPVPALVFALVLVLAYSSSHTLYS